MMFEAFQRNFRRDHPVTTDAGNTAYQSDIPILGELIAQFGGSSFNDGLYRIVHAKAVEEWAARIAYAFPVFAGRIVCFGYDWLGGAFAIDLQRLEGAQPGIVMFEPGTGRALKIPCNIETFHDRELIEFGEAVLAIDFHNRWLSAGGAAPDYAQCVGYRKPLFLGGKDDLSNLEISDLDVYWHIFGQLVVKTRTLRAGTPVRTKLE